MKKLSLKLRKFFLGMSVTFTALSFMFAILANPESDNIFTIYGICIPIAIVGYITSLMINHTYIFFGSLAGIALVILTAVSMHSKCFKYRRKFKRLYLENDEDYKQVFLYGYYSYKLQDNSIIIYK